MDDLVAVDAEQRGAEDLLSLSASTSTFMKPWVSPRSRARPTRVIGITPTSAGLPAGPHLGLAHADAAERRVDEEGIGRDAVGDPPLPPSSRLPATIWKSLYEVWVKAPRPLASPSAQTPGTLVRSSSSTVM